MTNHSRRSTLSTIVLAAVIVAVAGLLGWLALEKERPEPVRESPTANVRFTDIADAAGILYVQADGEKLNACGLGCMALVMSGGAAAGDFDGDGRTDIYATRAEEPGILYRNNGDGTFDDVTEETGLADAAGANGAGWADLDNDGDQDLYVMTIGLDRNLLYMNDGEGHFTEEGVSRGAAVLYDEPHQGQSVAFGDYDNDGWIDIHTTQWGHDVRTSGTRLLHNLGPERPAEFEDVTERMGMGTRAITMDSVPYGDDTPGAVALRNALVMGGYAGQFAFASAFADLDGDGWQDLTVVADFDSSRLFWNDGGAGFVDGTRSAHVGTDKNGMGSTFGDYDGDGDLDWFVSAIYAPQGVRNDGSTEYDGNRLFRYDGDRAFTDVTEEAGVLDGLWAWGTSFMDHDNDGDLDLALTDGFRVLKHFRGGPMRFWDNSGDGTFRDIAAQVGLTDEDIGFGLLTLDFDDDGDLDIFVANNGQTPRLYRNDGGNGNAWLRVRVEGTTSNRDGIGAKVTLRQRKDGPVQYREIGSMSHYLGQSERVAHFGLGRGAADVAEVRVVWPATGREVVLTDVPANSTVVVTEPAE